MEFFIGLLIGFVGGAVTSYLFFRNNKNIKDKVDDITDNIDNTIG